MALGLQYMIETVNDWRKKYHVNKEGDVVFQNKRTFANVSFSDNSLHQIEKHPRGFSEIPVTITDPDEIWSLWEDPASQKIVLRNYIRFGQYPYIVQTRNGRITDAFLVAPRSANKYRKGVII